MSAVAAVSLALLIPGCTFVSLQTDASQVERIEAAAAADCEELGITRVEVLHEVGFLTRNPSKDVKDWIYKIKPFNKNKRLTRSRIGNFFYKLEADSRRVKVTSIKLTPFKKIKPGEVGEDVWTFECAITSRSQINT